MAIDTRERPAMRENAPSRVAALAATGIRKEFRPSRLEAGRGAHLLAVDDVSLRVERGEIYSLLGANGSGKSTLIRVFSTLLTADAGEVRIFGLDIRRDELAVKRLINRVSVEASFFKKLSAMENLVAEGTAAELTTRYGASTLEEVFMTATGRRLDDADATNAERSE